MSNSGGPSQGTSGPGRRWWRRTVPGRAGWSRCGCIRSCGVASILRTFGDGSVKFLKDKINSWKLGADATVVGLSQDSRGFYHLAPGTQWGVYQALSTRSGGEVVSSDSF